MCTDFDSSVVNLSTKSEFFFRIAVKEIESWILADRINFSNYLGIPVQRIPLITDEINNPKQFILNLSDKSKKSSLRNGMIFRHKDTLKPGPDYNAKNWQKKANRLIHYANDQLLKNKVYTTFTNFGLSWKRSR